MAQIIATSVDGLIVVDEAGKILFANAAAEKLFSVDAAALVGKDFGFPLVTDEFVEIDIYQGQARSAVVEMRRTRIDWSGNPAWLVNLRDITERKLNEEQMIALNRTLDQRNWDLYYLYETGTALARQIELKDICWTLFNMLAQTILHSDDFIALTYDAQNNLLKCQFAVVAGSERPREHFPAMPLSGGRIEEVLRAREILTVDYRQDYERPKCLADLEHTLDLPQPQSALYLPIVIADNALGVMIFQSLQPNAYASINHYLLSTIATQAAIAIENGLLYHEILNHAATLEARVVERTAQLEQLNRRISAILDNAFEPILLITQEGDLEMANPEFDKVFGSGIEQRPLKSLADVVCDNSQDIMKAAIHKVLTDGQPERVQLKCKRKDNTTFDAEIALARVADNANQLVCTIFDITRFKEIERMKSQFVSMVSHELRTPVASVLLTTETLMKYYERMSDETRRDKLGQIQEQAEALTELVISILELSRIEGRNPADTRETVDLLQVARKVIGELRFSAEAKGQNISFASAVEQALLSGDPLDFHRIWQNLIANAIKYTPPGGNISVTLTSSEVDDDLRPLNADPEQLYVVGMVSDDGPGIPSEDLELLFTRFFRGRAKYSQVPGTGLGLAIVRETLRLYGGDISVASNGDRGSTFTFWIPVQIQH